MKSNFGRVCGLVIAGLLVCAGSLAAQQPADMILKSGKIVTVDKNFSMAQAVAIRGNQIVAVGSDADVLKLAGPQTQQVDLKGRTVIPGLIDTHRHIFSANYDGKMTPEKARQYPIDWRAIRTTEDVLNQIRSVMAKYKFKPGEWVFIASQGLQVMGGNSNQETQVKILMNDLTRFELDKVTPDNPIIMSMGTPNQNGLLINTKAYDILMAKHGDFVKQYGRLWLGANGLPDGHVEPPAARIVRMLPPGPDPAAFAAEFKLTLDELGSMGMTTVSTQLTEDLLKPYQYLESNDQLTIRMAYGRAWDFGTVGDLKNKTKEFAKMQGTGTDKIWITSVSASAADGAGSRTCMSVPRKATYGAIDDWYPMGQCHMDAEYKGAADKNARAPGNYYREWVVEGGVNGLRFANTHVGGDRTVTLLLGLGEQVNQRAGKKMTTTWAFDHCEMVNPRDFKKIAELGITLSCGPQWIFNTAPRAAESYGDNVANQWVEPLKSALDAGVKLVFEADNNNYVWGEFESLMTRKDKNGKVWGPQEKLDRATILKMATINGAEYILKPDKLGSIEVGKWADLAVLDKDYMTIPAEEIHTIQPQLTVFDGKVVFTTPAFQQESGIKTSAGAVVSTYDQLTARRGRGGFNPTTF